MCTRRPSSTTTGPQDVLVERPQQDAFRSLPLAGRTVPFDHLPPLAGLAQFLQPHQQWVLDISQCSLQCQRRVTFRSGSFEQACRATTPRQTADRDVSARNLGTRPGSKGTKTVWEFDLQGDSAPAPYQAGSTGDPRRDARSRFTALSKRPRDSNGPEWRYRLLDLFDRCQRRAETAITGLARAGCRPGEEAKVAVARSCDLGDSLQRKVVERIALAHPCG